MAGLVRLSFWVRVERMADFAAWGYAISEAMGYKGEKFLEIYNRNLNSQNEEVLTNSLVALAVYGSVSFGGTF